MLPLQTQLEAGTFRLSTDQLTVTARETRSADRSATPGGRRSGGAPRPGPSCPTDPRRAPRSAVTRPGSAFSWAWRRWTAYRWVSAVNYNRAVPWVIAEVTEEGQPTGKEISATDVAKH